MRADADLVWLLDVILPGLTLRLSTRPLVLTDGAAVVEYAGGLSDVDYAEQIDLLSVQPASQTVAVEGYTDPAPADLAALGIDLREASATLRYLLVDPARTAAPPAQDLSAAVTVAVGRLAQPAWGDPLKPRAWFSASVEATPWFASVPLLSPNAVIRAADFTTARAAEVGKPYPLVIGQPGRASVGLFSTPAYPIQTSAGSGLIEHLLIAGYDATAPGDNVTVSDGDASEVHAVEYGVTATGEPYYFVDITGSAVLNNAADHEPYSIAWSTASGAAVQPGSAAPSVGVVLRYLLTRAGVPFDVAGSAAAIAALKPIRFDAYLNDPEAGAWEYLSDRVLRFLPLTLRMGPAGLEIGHLDADIQPEHAAARVSADDGWTRLEAVVYDDAPAPVRLTIRGGTNVNTNGFAKIITLDSTATASTADYTRAGIGARVNAPTTAGQPPRAEAIDVPWCQDEASLFTLGLSYLSLRSARPFSTAYSAPLTWAHLRPGDAVALTDAAAGWADKVAWVRSKRWAAGRWIFDVWGVDRPAWDSYSGS
jgi:hypothetical protein